MTNIQNTSEATVGGARLGGLASILILALGTFAVGTDAFVVAGFLPGMAHSLDVTESAAGQSVTVFAITYALAAPVIATVTGTLPRRALLTGALCLLALANLGAALAPGLSVLLASRVVAALAAAAYTPTAGAVGAALVPAELRGRALAVVVGGLTVATAVGVPLGNLASQWMGWRTALGLVASLCLVAALGVRLRLPESPGSTPVPVARRLAVLWRPGVLAVLPLTVLGMGASYTVYAYSIPTLNALGIDETAIAAMLFLYGLGAVGGNFLSGHGTDRWGPLRVLACGYLGMGIALATMALAAAAAIDLPGPAVAVVVFLWGATTWTQTPAQQHRLIAAAPSEASLVVSLNASCIYLGIGLGTVLGGLALERGAIPVYALATVLALAAIMFLWITKRAAVQVPEGAR